VAQFIFAIIFWLAAVIAVLYGVFLAEGNRGLVITASVIAALLGFGLFAWGGVKSVPVKNIGIPQSFGAIGSSVYQPGAHETWTPWMSITDINETIQTTTFEDKGNDNGTSCNGGLPVRIGGQQTACADVTIQWQIRPQAAASLFSDYANQGNFMAEITNAVVVRELKQVVNNDLGDYNPITDVQAVTSTGTQTSQFTTLGPKILSDMKADIGNRVNILTLLLPQLHYATPLENKLSGIQQSYADFAVAQENVKVAQQEQLALVALKNPSLNQLIAQCLVDSKTDTNLQCIPGATSNLQLSGGAAK
jgi:hypothetical protein